MQALMSRSIYLDLKMHSRREVMTWTHHLVLHNQILQRIGCTEAQELEAISWLEKNQADLRELSIRTAIKLGKFMKMNDTNWERVAEMTLLRGV